MMLARNESVSPFGDNWEKSYSRYENPKADPGQILKFGVFLTKWVKNW